MTNPKVLKLSDLNGSNGFTINGNDTDSLGTSVSNAGDINGDKIDDLIIGAPGAGKSYVVFGSKNSFSKSLDLASLDGSNGFTINGNGTDSLGTSVSNAGDINGDGIDDLIIGAPGGASGAGQSYVVFGSKNSFSKSLDLSSLDGSNGFSINGINGVNSNGSPSDSSGTSVSSAGDINGDKIDDLIIGAPGAGQSYVVFGSKNSFNASLDLSSLNGSNGFAIKGNGTDSLGTSVSSVGDINGDKIDDLIIGAPGAGKSYVVFGTKNSFSASFNPSSLNGSNGFAIKGNASDFFGVSVSNAGDINGDGIDDLIIGAPNAASGAGRSYVVFGSKNGFSKNFDLSSLNGKNGFSINGINGNDNSGISVSNAGDVNDDGIDDLILGASSATAGAGQSYVVFGSKNGFDASLNLSNLSPSKGFTINGINANDSSGISVSGAGDINGDGADDLLVGALNANSGAGQSYVIFGTPKALVAVADMATTNEDTAVKILVLANDSDRKSLTVTKVNGSAVTVGTPITLSSGAILSLNADKTFSYNPNAQFETLAGGQTGKDSFTYTISDGISTSTAKVNVTIKGVNDAPVAVNDSVNTAKNTAVSIQAKTLLANDSDIDSTNLSITGVSGAINGTAVLKNNGTPNNSADDFIVFTPNKKFSGTASFNYTISDTQLASTAKVTVQVSDRLFSGKGKQTIVGVNGNDILVRSNGKNKLVLVAKQDPITIVDFNNSTDLIGLSGNLSFNQLSFSGNKIILNDTHETLAALTGIDTTTLTAANFTLF